MEMEKKNVAIIVLAIALAASGVGNIILGIIAGFIEPFAPEKRILTYVDTSTPYVLDPVDCWDAYSGLIIEQCAETLFTYNYSDNGQNLELMPLLATGYVYNDAGDHPFYDITLRQGVKFHDGTDWNAAACKFNLDRWDYWFNLTGACPGGEVLGYPEYIYHFADGVTPLFNETEIISTYVVRIHMTSAYVAFIDLLTYTAGSMISPASFGNDYTADFIPFDGDIVGTGPFDFISYEAAVETTFKRNDNYWGEKPYFEEVKIIYFDDSVSMNSAMLAAEYDFMEGCLPDLIPQFRVSPVVDYVNFTALYGDLSNGYGYVGLNNVQIPQAVREALNWATDQEYLKYEILEGVVEPAKTPVPGVFLGSKQSYLCYQNITKAREIMNTYDDPYFPDDLYDDAAWQALADGASPKYNYSIWKYTPSETYQKYFETFRAWFREIGIFLYKKDTYWGTFINNMKQDPNWLDMWPIGWIPDYLNPLNMLAPLFHPLSTADYTQMNDAQTITWLEAAFAETNEAAFVTLMEDIQDRLMQVVFPHIPLDYGQLFYIKVPELVVPNYNANQRLYFADWYKVALE
jgi:ABC-type transport system substrate-binding protein